MKVITAGPSENQFASSPRYQMTEKRIGIIGCGTVTEKSYVPSLKRMEGVKVDYVYDVNDANSRKVADLLSAKVEKPDFILKCRREFHHPICKHKLYPVGQITVPAEVQRKFHVSRT